MNTWLIIANSTEALIYNITPADPHKKHFDPLKELSHQESRLKSSELGNDENGRYQSQSAPKSAYEPSTTPHEKEIQHFAEELADYLDAERNQNHYKHLVLCAAPHFYGLLKAALTKQTAALVKQHIDKDYIPLSKAELHERVKEIYQHNLVT